MQLPISHYMVTLDVGISYRLRDIGAFSSKIACFPHHTVIWRPQSRNALRYQRILFTSDKNI